MRRLERSGLIAVEVVGRTKFLTANLADPATRALRRALALAETQGGDMAKKKKKSKKGGKKKKKK